MKLRLLPLSEIFAVCRLPPRGQPPAWAESGELCSVTRTPDELSIVCRESNVPADVRAERGWRALRVQGTLDFSEVGILADLSSHLASAGVSLFAISTYDTDYLFVRDRDWEKALEALRIGGHLVSHS